MECKKKMPVLWTTLPRFVVHTNLVKGEKGINIFFIHISAAQKINKSEEMAVTNYKSSRKTLL